MLIVQSKPLKKFESYKLYFLYCCLSILHMLNKLDNFKLKKYCKNFLKNVIKKNDKEQIFIKNSPNLVYSNKL